MTVTPATIAWYLDRGFDLVPSRPGDPKRPLENWRTASYTKTQLEEIAARGQGLIYRIGRGEIVIDADVYKPNVRAAYQQFISEMGVVILSEICPTVMTPRGGRHHYFRRAPGADYRKHIERFGKGVEFLHHGHYVLVPGSPHPDVPGVFYQWDHSSQLGAPIPTVPAWLHHDLEVPYNPELDQRCPNWDGATLRHVLSYLPVTSFGSNADWEPVLFGAHFATGGSSEGRAEFVDWSISDPRYQYDARHIENRWNSLTTTDKALYQTQGTLLKIVQRTVGYLPTDLIGSVEWADTGPINTETQPPAPAPVVNGPPISTPVESTGPTSVAQSAPFVAPNTPPHQLPPRPAGRAPDPSVLSTAALILNITNRIDEFSEFTASRDIEDCLTQIAKLDGLQRSKFIRQIQQRTGIPVRDLKKKVSEKDAGNFAAQKDLGRRSRIEVADAMAAGEDPDQTPVPADIGQYLAEMVLQRYYADGAHLVYTPEGAFYSYCGTHWTPKSKAAVDGDIHTEALRLQAELSAAAGFAVSVLMGQTSKILQAMCAKKGEHFFQRTETPPPVINCRNGELWIDGPTGRPVFKQHSPKSALRNCLSIEYDPAARCPQWLDAICGMFAPLNNPVGVAAHLMEVIGYTIQPRKNIAAWVLLYGSGNNGKSLVLDVLTALLGDAVISVPLGNLSTDAHAYAMVANRLAVIEDDLKKGIPLPDDILKKLSENKLLTANPKFQSPYQFKNTSTAWISSNHWPKSPDMSEGMKRRPYVFEFQRNFELEGCINRDLKEIIVDSELPGVLNTAIAGLMRMRERGFLERPEDCEVSRKKWLDSSNQIRTFLAEKTERSNDSILPVQGLFEKYRVWCDAVGIKRAFSRASLIAEIASAGLKVSYEKNTGQCVTGLKLKDDW